MATVRKGAERLIDRTPVAEWIAAGAGLVLTLGVLGYTLWEGLTQDQGPPQLSIVAEPAVSTPGGFVVPIVVKNQSHATAAQVTVRGRLQSAGQAEERTAQFTYVPGRGEAQGGLLFQADPRKGRVVYSVDGFAAP